MPKSASGVPYNITLDNIAKSCGVTTNAALASALGVSESLISYIRSGKRPLGSDVILAAYERLNISVSDVRAWMEQDRAVAVDDEIND